MTEMDILLTVLFNALPIIIIIIPYFFIRRKLVGKLYFRLLMGIIVFYAVYWILPIIFQATTPPKELTGGDFGLGVVYIIAHFSSLIALFGSYPLITLPFIFFVAPFL
jgi:hypothetical protein